MYEWVSRLEGSELSELFRARRDAVPVVVKLFHPATSSTTYAQVVSRVGERLARTPHPAVLGPVDVGMEGDRLAVVRQDGGGVSLGVLLQAVSRREAELPPPLVVSLWAGLLEALEALHGQGVVHGALTPGNVMLSASGLVQVADVGAWEALCAVPRLREAFAAKGRSTYRAPELSAQARATPAMDVYAASAVAYELLTLREPRAASGRRGQGALTAPSRLVPGLGTRYDAVLARALSADPRERPAPGALARQLHELGAALGGLPGQEEARAHLEATFPRGTVGPLERPRSGTFSLQPLAEVESQEAWSGGDLAERASFSGGGEPDSPRTELGVPALDLARPLPRGQAAREGARPDAEAARRPVPATLQTFAASFRRDSDVQPPDHEAPRRERARRARQAAVGGTVIVTAFLVGVTVLWLSLEDPLGFLVDSLPRPLQVLFRDPQAPAPPPPRLRPWLLPVFPERDAGASGSSGQTADGAKGPGLD